MIGATMKHIRVLKGMAQKEVYSGVVSKSFYSDFEKEKSSIEITKFLALLDNLGISLTEFDYFKNEARVQQNLADKVETLYKQGQFQELYAFYLQHKQDNSTTIRYTAIKAYLFVLLTKANFYNFSRAPFDEIVCEIENYKAWTLREIALAKLVLLSLAEQDKQRATAMYERIVSELEKYKKLDNELYHKEMADLFFNRVQSLLITNDVAAAQKLLSTYQANSSESDNLHWLIQNSFITHLVHLYSAFPTAQADMKSFLGQLQSLPSSEVNFYTVIFDIHQEKAKNYYARYVLR